MVIKKSFDTYVANQPCLLSTYISAPEPDQSCLRPSSFTQLVTDIQKELGLLRQNFRNLHR